MIAAYVRISTSKQKDGVSIESQIAIISEYAIRFELIEQKEEIKFYIDEGFSGKSLERPAMQNLINDIKKGNISILFCYDLSRISRDLFDSNLFLNLMKKYNVIFKSLYEDAKIETAGDRFTTNIKILNNQYERERVVERTNDSLLSIAESGRYPCGGKIIFGYKRDINKDIVFHEEHHIIVKNIFKMAADGYFIDEITQYANDSQSERVFNNFQIKKMISNEKYTGVMTYKGKIYTDIIPSLVDENTFKTAGSNIKIWKFKENQNYIFDGIVYCAVCGNKMSCTHSHGRSRKYYYYYCSHCNSAISQKALEKFLTEINQIENGNNNKRMKKMITRKETLTNRINRIKDEYINQKFTDREFITMAIPLEDELEKINILISSFKISHKEFSFNEKATIHEKKKYVLTHIKRINVNPVAKKIQNIEFI